nr:PLD nuclease N-terminal domain-containing protein [Polaribacter litorisediminis]
MQISFLVSILLSIYCLINLLKHKFENNDKLIWILVVIFLPILGSILYLSIGKRKKLNIH